MDAATLIVIALLVIAASLASYLLRQWSAIRNGEAGIGWVALGMATTLLLAAAVLVLSMSFLPALRLSINQFAMPDSVQVGRGLSGGVSPRETAPAGFAVATMAPVAPTNPSVSAAGSGYVAQDSAQPRSDEPIVPALPSSWNAEAAGSRAALNRPSFALAEAYPWAATNCVYALNPDPANLSRWTIENDCGAPIGAVFASCAKSVAECSNRESASWVYENGGMILPGRAQRFVTSVEETRYGKQVRYIACKLTNPVAIGLIGQSSESRSTSVWSEQFDAARGDDDCLKRVQEWSDAARRSGKSIDATFGPNVPGRVRSSEGYPALPLP